MFVIFFFSGYRYTKQVAERRKYNYHQRKEVLLKSNFLLCRLFFLIDHNFISNEGNLIIFFCNRKILLRGLSCDIKSLFQNSVDKKLQIFHFIFHPILLHFFGIFYNDFIPLSNIFRSQKK